jgi:hypothetical protein
MILPRFTLLDGDVAPLELAELPTPISGRGEVLVRVAACGVCHTDLDEIEGRVAKTGTSAPSISPAGVVGMCMREHDGVRRNVANPAASRFPAVDHRAPSTKRNQQRGVRSMALVFRFNVSSCAKKRELHRG